MIYLLKHRAYCLLGFGMDQLGKVHPIGFGHSACLLVATICVVVNELIGFVCCVHAPMILAERAVLLCPAILGLLGDM